jgi:hypothetical protein
MADPFTLDPDSNNDAFSDNPADALSGLISPVDAQTLVTPPPSTPARSGAGQTTPQTGNLNYAPRQATPKVSGPPMIPGIATKPENLKLGPGKLAAQMASIRAASQAQAPSIPAMPAASAPSRGASPTPRIVTPGFIEPKIIEPEIATPKIIEGKGGVIEGATPITPRQVDPESGRVITQPTDDPKINQELATKAMPAYRAGLEKAIHSIPGAELAATRSKKNPDRLKEKIEEEGQPAETVSDYGAAQVSVDSRKAKDAVVAAVKKQFSAVKEQDNFEQGDPEYGYRSYSLQLEMPNGSSQELQIVPREVREANGAEHKEYKGARDAQLAGRSAERPRAAAKAQNDSAMAKFNGRDQSRSSGFALAKGAAVALPDGSRGVVSYLDPNMKIARVRTEDGRNITVRQNQLKAPKEAPAGS